MSKTNCHYEWQNFWDGVLDFVHPEEMPSLYNSCKYVWCWEEPGTIDDFSNIIWESAFCHIPCIVSLEVAKKIKTQEIPKYFAEFFYQMDAQSLMEFDFTNPMKAFIDDQGRKVSLFEKYIEANIGLYKTLI